MSKWILMPIPLKAPCPPRDLPDNADALLCHVPDVEIVSIPVADGGEGSVDAFLTAVGGHRVEVECTGPDFRKVTVDGSAVLTAILRSSRWRPPLGCSLMEGRLLCRGRGRLMGEES
ncbi:MAG: glycerate kinase [Oscillospiraceae bacterium]